MKRIAATVTAFLLVGLYASEARAQSVSIKSIDNSTAGQLTVSAQVTVPQNWTLIYVDMLARPPKGAAGQGGQASGKDTGGNVYAGTITNLTSGKDYDVQALMKVNDDKGISHYYYSAVQSATVK